MLIIILSFHSLKVGYKHIRVYVVGQWDDCFHSLKVGYKHIRVYVVGQWDDCFHSLKVGYKLTEAQPGSVQADQVFIP